MLKGTVDIEERFKTSFNTESAQWIGGGGFGNVYKANQIIDKKDYAVKIQKASNANKLQRFYNEIQAMSKIERHANIVHYYGAWVEEFEFITENDGKLDEISRLSISSQSQSRVGNSSNASNISTSTITATTTTTSSNSNSRIYDESAILKHLKDSHWKSYMNKFIYIQMELCQMTLEDWMLKGERSVFPVSPDSKYIYFQVTVGIAFIHKNKIVHCDIRPRNIFMNKLKDKFQVKIGDFGLSKESSAPTISSFNEYAWDPYEAPESAKSRVFNEKSDIYSIGILLFALLYPVNTEREKFENIMILRKEKIFPDAMNQNNMVNEISQIKELIEDRPNQRPGIKKAKRWAKFYHNNKLDKM